MNEHEEEKSFSFVDKRRRNDEPGEETMGEIVDDKPQSEPAPEEGKTSPATDVDTADQPSQKAPPLDFGGFIISLYSTAIYHLGGFQDPVSGKTSLNLDLAKQNIDIIGIIEEKTRGNLTQDEERLVKQTLYDLRMKFIEAQKGAKAI